MRSAWVVLALLMPGCFLFADGGCSEYGRTGLWTQPGLYDWVLAHGNATGLLLRMDTARAGANVTSLAGAAWRHNATVYRAVESIGRNGLQMFGDGLAAYLPKTWSEAQTRDAIAHFLATVSAAPTEQQARWVDEAMAKPIPATPGPYAIRRVALTAPYRFQAMLADGAWAPSDAKPGTLTLAQGDWSVSLGFPTARLSHAPSPVYGRVTSDQVLMVDSQDRVAGGHADGRPAQDAWWQANATADFAHWGIPTPTFQDVGHDAQEECA